MNKRSRTLFALFLGVALFFGVNIFATVGLRSLRFDLTEGKLFTLSAGSRNIAKQVDEPLRLYYYFSETAASEAPQYKAYGNRVRELLEEYAYSSDGNILLEVIEPEPFSEEEDRAIQEGVQGRQLPSGDALYMGLVGTNSTDDREVIAVLDISRERFLEYDVSRLIYTLAHPKKPLVGILSGLPLEGSPPNPMTGQPGQPGWQIVEQMRSFFDVETLTHDLMTIEEDVDLLLLIHPRDLPEPALYAIDQFVLRGGKLVALVDPHCDADMSQTDPTNPMASMGASKASGLEPLFGAWGVELVKSKVVGDRLNALRVQAGSPNQPEAVDYVVWLGVDEAAFNKEDAVTSLLRSMNIISAGVLKPVDGATTTFEPLIRTSEEAMQLDVGMVQFMPDPKALLAQYVPEFQRLTLAARIQGPAESAYPDGNPAGSEVGGEHLASGDIQVIVMSDADFLADRFWIREQKLGPLSLGFAKVADNGDFVINALENMAGGDDLISVRARGEFARPFEVVEEIRRDAEQRFLDEERELQSKLDEAQRRIDQIQSEKSADELAFITPAEQAEIEKWEQEKLANRKKLRDVRHSLRKDIEGLGTQIKFLNVLALPGLIALVAVALGVVRVQRRTKK